MADFPDSLVTDLSMFMDEHDVAPEGVSRIVDDLDSLNVMEQEAKAEEETELKFDKEEARQCG